MTNEKILPQVERNHTAAPESPKSERAGANRTHSLIASNFTIAVGYRLHGQKTEVYVGNMRVQINANRFAYPDVTIVGGKPAFADNLSSVLLNPTVVVEIFSTKTNTQDKTEKLESYLAMESIRECLLIKEDEMRVEHYSKQSAKQWIYRIYNDKEEIVALDSINCKVSLTEIYSQIHAEITGRKVGV